MALTVPSGQIASIKKFLELPDDKIQEFLDALSHAGPHFNMRDLGTAVLEKTKFAPELVRGIVLVLGSLYLTQDAQGTPLEQFVDGEVLAALKNTDAFSKERFGTQWDRLRNFLLTALSLENTVGTSAKAGHVLTQHERIFVTARVLTDIRHVFHRDVNEKPNAALIVHMLKITERDNNGNTNDKYFALDSNDVRRLRALLDRAIAKEETLKKLLSESSVSLLPPKDSF